MIPSVESNFGAPLDDDFIRLSDGRLIG